MYTNGSKEIKEWINAFEKMLKEEVPAGNIGNQNLGMASDNDPNREPEEDIEEPPRSPYDILETVRDICNRNLKDSEDDEEIEKILKEIANEVKSYVSSEEEEEEDIPGEQQPSRPDPNAQAPMGDTGMNQDLGAPGGDMATAAGGGMNMAPMGGGQM